MRTGQYRHQPIRRVHLPKDGGKTRPIGISTVEDKVVQGAITRVLESICEQDFLSCSYGFRRGRRAHDALRALQHAAYRGEVQWVLELDIQAYFDSLDRNKLYEMLRLRIADERFLRLIGKCVHVGVLEGTEYSDPDEGTAQGSVLSPMLGNIYLHHVLDLWFEHQVRPRMRGQAILVRYADDAVLGFERREDAERVMKVLPLRMAKYGLRLHPDKTRLASFRRPARESTQRKGPATFDFLGFTFYWRRNRKGWWVPGLKTRKAKLHKAIQAFGDWCQRHRHQPLKERHAALCIRLRGHYNYFGVNGNDRSLRLLRWEVGRRWFKWLRRRGQRRRLTWERFNELLEAHPFPRSGVYVQLWA